MAQVYMIVENNIVVLSDYKSNQSFIFIGGFGGVLGLEKGRIESVSAFEKLIFEKVYPEDLLQRHALELNFLRSQKLIPAGQRHLYSSHCRLRFKGADGNLIFVSHRMQYIKSLDSGDIRLSLCTYSPPVASGAWNGIEGRILNSMTGSVQVFEDFLDTGKVLLSSREIQIIRLLSKGCSSKQIASELHIAVNTTFRHRQNILKKLNVYNTSQAIQVCMVLGIL